jgi:acyl-coenzyme A synthetase/AMP-(fatty) acid ligase
MHNIVYDLVYKHAGERPESAAVISGQGEIISYAQLARLVGQMANYLRHCGVAAGRVTGISMGTHPVHVVTMLAVAQLGGVSLPLHPMVPMERRMLAARRFGATCVISGRQDMALNGLEFIGVNESIFEGSRSADDAIHPATPDDPMRIIISSGTSGDPKGMILTHGNMSSRIHTSEAGAQSNSRVLPMDINFINGFRPAVSSLARGGTLVFPVSHMLEHVLLALITQKVTHVYFSPFHVRQLVGIIAPNVVTACPDLVSLRIGGASIAPDLLHTVRRRITQNVHISYGSTESGMVSYATPEMLEKYPDTVGKLCKWAEVEIVDEQNLPRKTGETGIIRIRSAHQVKGYYRDDNRTREHFRDGWFYPGDLGRFNEEGLLFIEGRLDDILNAGGAKINPEDIESVLVSHPAVADAGAFIAMPQEGGEVLAVALVLNNPARLNEVANYAQAKLGPLAPAHYEIVQHLPRTPTGKLRRDMLTLGGQAAAS